MTVSLYRQNLAALPLYFKFFNDAGQSSVDDLFSESLAIFRCNRKIILSDSF